MKRLALALCFALCITVTACGGSKSSDQGKTETTVAATTAAETKVSEATAEAAQDEAETKAALEAVGELDPANDHILSYCGLKFTIPEEFTYLPDGSTDLSWAYYIPEENGIGMVIIAAENYPATEAEFLADGLDRFVSNITGVYQNVEQLTTQDIEIAGHKGGLVKFTGATDEVVFENQFAYWCMEDYNRILSIYVAKYPDMTEDYDALMQSMIDTVEIEKK